MKNQGTEKPTDKEVFSRAKWLRSIGVTDTIQDDCKHGYILPDRCRYTRHLGCDCGAYPPIKEPVTNTKE
jgi:hypothetical protein